MSQGRLQKVLKRKPKKIDELTYAEPTTTGTDAVKARKDKMVEKKWAIQFDIYDQKG